VDSTLMSTFFPVGPGIQGCPPLRPSRRQDETQGKRSGAVRAN